MLIRARFRLVLAAALVLAATALAPALAGERVLSFVSDAAIARNGDLAVTETIRVEAGGDLIRHGINRDVPTRYRDNHGGLIRAVLSVESVSRDGKAEPYALQALDSGVRIAIGSAGTRLSPGPHDYVIRYRTSRQIRFFAEMDELYFAVTGADWPFPIDSVEARVALPEPVPFRDTTAFTGPPAAGEHAAMVIEDAAHPGTVIIRSSHPLAAGNGLTIALTWQKGIVDPPSLNRRIRWWVSDNGSALVALVGAMLTLGYFAFVWLRIGRDASPAVLPPAFEPPDGISAAAARYLHVMNIDERTFAAALLDSAVHGHLTLSDEGPTLVVAARGGTIPLPPAEAAMKTALFMTSQTLPLTQDRHAAIAGARAALTRGLARAYASPLFHWNGGWLAGGIALTLLAYAATLAALMLTDGERGLKAAAGLVLLSLAGIVAGAALTAGPSGRMLLSRLAAIIVIGVLALGCGAVGLLLVIDNVDAPFGLLPLLLPMGVVPLAVSACGWMRSPTAEGQKLRDAVAGFRQYLGLAGEPSSEEWPEPLRTPELFARYLPYAVALDVENAWAAKCSDSLTPAGAAAAVSAWYPTNTHHDPGSLVARIGSQLTRAVASASIAPGSRGSMPAEGDGEGGEPL